MPALISNAPTAKPKMDPTSALDGMHMAGLDPDTGKAVVPRLSSVEKALSIYQTLAKADEGAALDRARVDAMFDGAAPYDQAKLISSGQGQKTNLNFLQGQRQLDIALSAYVDLYSSLETLLEVKHTRTLRKEIGAEPVAVLEEGTGYSENEQIVAEEITHLLRTWPEFHSLFLRLCTIAIKHGVGITYFENPDDWRFGVAGWDEVLIPRQSKASEENITVAVARRRYLLHQLYGFIENERAATASGWDVEEVKRVLMKNATTSSRGGGNRGYTSYEELQAEMKNNDIYASFGSQNPQVDVLHFWVREMDGSVSHLICAENDPKEFLYKKISRFESPEQAYCFFAFGVGTNGTYHSIRGLGQRIFSLVQASNRLRSQMIDSALLSSGVMIQPEDDRAMQELGFSSYGPFHVLSPRVSVIEKAIPDLSRAVVPAMKDLTEQLNLNTDAVSTYPPDGGSSPYKNQMQVATDMDVATRLSGANLNLFYMSWNRLLREITRRLIKKAGKSGKGGVEKDKHLEQFFTQCESRGVPRSFIAGLDPTRTKAVRSVGGGSQANRAVVLRELQGMAGSFDDVGRRHLMHDIVANKVGHDLANRYVPRSVEDRPNIHNKVAFFENDYLMQGKEVPVTPNELHGTHVTVHLPFFEQFVDQIENGQVDPLEMLPVLVGFYKHISGHQPYIEADAVMETLARRIKQVLQRAEEHVHNAMKRKEAAEREQAQAAMEQEAASQQEGGTPLSPEAQAKIAVMKEMSAARVEIMKAEAATKLEIKQREHSQNAAIKDAKTALDIRAQNGIDPQV